MYCQQTGRSPRTKMTRTQTQKLLKVRLSLCPSSYRRDDRNNTDADEEIRQIDTVSRAPYAALAAQFCAVDSGRVRAQINSYQRGLTGATLLGTATPLG